MYGLWFGVRVDSLGLMVLGLRGLRVGFWVLLLERQWFVDYTFNWQLPMVWVGFPRFCMTWLASRISECGACGWAYRIEGLGFRG